MTGTEEIQGVDVTAVVSAVWMSGIFAAVFAGLALFFAVRLLASRRDASGGGCCTDPDNTDPSDTDRGADASHGVMSLGMAAMFSPWGNPVPALYGQVLFSVTAVWFAVRLLRRGTRSIRHGPGRGTDLHHVLASGAMVYMLAAVPTGHAMTHGMTPGIETPGPGIALPALAWAFVAYFLVFAVWLGARLVEPGRWRATSTVATTSAGAAALDGGPRGVVTSPHLLGSSRVVMGIGMSYMLVTML